MNKVSPQAEDQAGEKFGLTGVSCTPSDSTHSENPKSKETLSIDKSDYKLVVDGLTDTIYAQNTSSVDQKRVEDCLDEGEQNQVAIDGHGVSLHVLKHITSCFVVLYTYMHSKVFKYSSPSHQVHTIHECKC